MKVGIYSQRVAHAPGFERVVSAHVQLPLRTIELLRKGGDHVELITTEWGNNRTLPACLPPSLRIHQVPYGTRQRQDLVMHVGNKRGIRPTHLWRQVDAIKKIVTTAQHDVLHCFGSARLAYLARLLRIAGLRIPIVLTLDSDDFLPVRSWWARQYVWPAISRVVTSTAFMKHLGESTGVDVTILRHGVGRNIKKEAGWSGSELARHRVLFWRDPSMENGADICASVFGKLAPVFPDVSFDLAVRPHWAAVSGLKELSDSHPNVNLHEFPYEGGTSLARLIKESICVVLPFRKLSTHPQLAVLESMSCGRAVITTAIGSNCELIQDGRTGFLVPVADEAATAHVVQELIVNRERAFSIGARAARAAAQHLHWTDYPLGLAAVYRAVT